MKKSLVAALLAFAMSANSFAQTSEVPVARDMTAKEVAEASAITDFVTTEIAILSGAAHEANPLLSGSVGGLIAVTGLKVAAVNWADKQDKDTREAVLTVAPSIWGGASINNLAHFAFHASNPVALAAGIVAGVVIWFKQKDKLAAEAKAANKK